jgi:AraC-like DNA-binding protein/ligand-binding sensor protein
MQPSHSQVSGLDTADRNNRHTVTQLEKSEIYRDYHGAFEGTTGLPLGMRATGSFQTALQGSRRRNAFCELMAGTNKTCASCLQLQQRVEQEANQGPVTLQCFAGLSESAVPIRVGANVVGYLQTGQVMLSKPTKARFAKVLAQLAVWKVPFNRSALENAYFGTRVLARRQYESALRLLAVFGQHLSGISNQIVVAENLSGAPVIAKARAFIAEHQSEELSLTVVARAVSLSEFYFCKMFKKETGLTFVDYLARVRVETLKKLLLNPHKRVSEAAYEAGFQSLSQFNRVFRRVAGEAPSKFRERLHIGIAPGGHSEALARAA